MRKSASFFLNSQIQHLQIELLCFVSHSRMSSVSFPPELKPPTLCVLSSSSAALGVSPAMKCQIVFHRICGFKVSQRWILSDGAVLFFTPLDEFSAPLHALDFKVLCSGAPSMQPEYIKPVITLHLQSSASISQWIFWGRVICEWQALRKLGYCQKHGWSQFWLNVV